MHTKLIFTKKFFFILSLLAIIPSAVIVKNIYTNNFKNNENVFATATTQLVVKDQESTCEPVQMFTEANGNTWKAQTAVAGVTGNLYRVKLDGNNNGGTSTLRIRAVSNGVPVGSDLGTTTITCGNVFEFNPPIHMDQGQEYSLLLSNDGAGFDWQYSNSNTCYPNSIGHPLTSVDNGQTWSIDQVDFYFSTYVIPDSQTGTPYTPPNVCTPAPTPGPAATKANLFVISLPGGSPQSTIESKTNDVISNLKKGFMYHGYMDQSVQPFLEYQVYGGIKYETIMPSRLANNNYDINSLYQRYNLCDLIQQKQVDEVWIWDSGQGGLPEWVTTGPNWPTDNVNNTPNCGRQISTLTFNNTRPTSLALHSYGHRLEGLFRKYFPCDFAPEWESGCTIPTGTSSGFVTSLLNNSSAQVAGCGNVHFPPNVVSGGDYQYGSTNQAPSICESWSMDGTSTIKNLDCSEWGCSELGYMVWWMQNIPGMNNTNKNRSGSLQPNWWTYLFSATPGQNTPPSPTPTPSPVPSSTPSPVPSSIPSPTPTVPPVTKTFIAIEDSYTNSGSRLKNYGKLDNLRIVQTANNTMFTYVKFNVAGISGKVISAKLRLYPYDISTRRTTVYTSQSNWSESTITWKNSPYLIQQISTLPSFAKNVWAEYDVTNTVTWSGTYSFAISGIDNVHFYSKEHATLKPELVVATQ